MVMGNGDLKKLSGEGNKGIAEGKMLLLASDIKRGKAIWKNRENKVKDDEGTMRRGMIVS